MASGDVMKGNVSQTSSEASGELDNAPGVDAEAFALQLKKQARRRLIGAIALALFGIITLPMVMDSQPRPVAPEIQVHIPSQESPGFNPKSSPSVTAKPGPLAPAANLEKTDIAATGVAAKASSGAEFGAKGAPAKDPESKTLADVTPTAGIQKLVATDSRAADQVPVSKPKTATDKGPESSTKIVGPGTVDPKSIDESRAVTAMNSAESLSAPWMVLLGVYKEAGNVRVLTAKVKEMKIPVSSEKFESAQGPRVRVKAGPFATRAEAEKAQARIRTIGVDGVLSQ